MTSQKNTYWLAPPSTSEYSSAAKSWCSSIRIGTGELSLFEDGNAHHQRRAGGISIHPLPLSAGLHGEGLAVPSEGATDQQTKLVSCPDPFARDYSASLLANYE